MLIVASDLQPVSGNNPIAFAPMRGERPSAVGLASAHPEQSFIAVVPDPDGSSAVLYVMDIGAEGQDAVLYGPIERKPIRDEALALKLVRSAFGDIRSLEPDQIDKIYRPLLSTPKTQLSTQKFTFGPEPKLAQQLTSVIIPFYGDGFFLNCVHHLQRVLPEGFELVLVVDDPQLWNEIHQALTLRSTGLRLPVQLLRNLANYGFGAANNLGVGLARGDVLLLMNSDIMVTDPAPLVRAADAIRERRRAGRPEAVIGFSLLYEDETIQHIGMEFRRSSAVGNLFLADHPMKGLPFAFAGVETVRPAQAVTGALMALSAELYQRLGGFDLVYERGDFEDADLCLKARKAGAEIEVHVHPGLYHLERQSIPRMGDADVRAMVTYMNCAEFNRRWAATLEPRKRVIRVGRPSAPA